MKRLVGRLALAVWLALAVAPSARAATTLDTPLAITLDAFRRVSCMDEGRYEYYRDVVRALDYTRMRALRAFCRLDGIYADEAVATLERLVFAPLSFDQVRFFEAFVGLEGATVASSWQLLELTSGLEFTALQAVLALAEVEALDADRALDLVEQVTGLDDHGRWAAQALFAVDGMDGPSAGRALALLRAMGDEQKLGAEQACLIEAMDRSTLMAILPILAALAPAEASNGRGLLALPSTTPDQALDWLRNYFSLPGGQADPRFYALTAAQRSTLLAAFDRAADYHIRTINDLHAVTDRHGAEISTATLAAGGAALLTATFDELHRRTRENYRTRLTEALGRNQTYQAIEVLKQATADARVQTARDLSTANIYVLLSRGSELFDSSFRDVLVPELLARIGQSFGGNLLHFLKLTDPENRHISDFVVSAAQKGKLTAFFPQDSGEQRAVLDLMAGSAFQDEQSLILFSATFGTLLAKLQPEARTYLLDKMIGTIRDPGSTFSLQLRVILQYYHDRHGDLLDAADRRLIADLIGRYGPVDLREYTAADFSRWKSDGSMRSLSVFQGDDDGRSSYLSNGANLLANGYRVRLPETFAGLVPDQAIRARATTLTGGADVHSLYRLSLDAPLIVEYYKTVNGIELTHAVTVYRDRQTQQRLLKEFLTSGMEMFAQRGHSYWREEQLLEPLRRLLESGEVSRGSIPEINRFLSIGSCGGLRIYSELNRLFDNTIDIFATVGTGKAMVNDPYNQRLFEIIAEAGGPMDWDQVSARLTPIFAAGRGADYLQPGSLPAILHKMMDRR